jgi:hypothetical protein
MHPTTKLNVISFFSCSPVVTVADHPAEQALERISEGHTPMSNMATLQTLVSDSLSRRFIDCDWAKNQ